MKTLRQNRIWLDRDVQAGVALLAPMLGALRTDRAEVAGFQPDTERFGLGFLGLHQT
jgi:hypothetical protein